MARLLAATEDGLYPGDYDVDDEPRAEHGHALRDLISTMPPRTLADAAVMVVCAALAAWDLNTLDNISDHARHHVRKIERMLLRTIPIVATAAGLDMRKMGWKPLEERRADLFGEGPEAPNP